MVMDDYPAHLKSAASKLTADEMRAIAIFLSKQLSENLAFFLEVKNVPVPTAWDDNGEPYKWERMGQFHLVVRDKAEQGPN